MLDLLPRLRDEGYDVELLLFDGFETSFRVQLEKTGITIHDFGKGGSVYSPKNLIRLIPFLKKYDIVHTHNTAPQFFAAIASLIYKTTIFTTEHGGSNRRRTIKGFRLIDKWMYGRYDRIICISDKAKDNLTTYLGATKSTITTVNNGVDVSKFADASASEDLEKLAPDSRKIVMVAGFRWEKDQPTLIKALKFLPASFHVFLIGDGVRRAEFGQLAQAEGMADRVHFLGIRSDIPELLHAADYIVMSSHFEGLSLSSVEGMSVGRPFLASDVDGLREVVAGAGVLFPHEDSKRLAEEILALETNPDKYRDVALKCAERAKLFDISEMVNGYLKEYNNLEK